MIQLQILSGQQAGSDIAVRRFPFVLGRASEADARFQDAGVWDRHCEICFSHKEGFQFVAHPDVALLVNGERAMDGTLRNGDLLELGSLRLRFWLARSHQKSLCVREGLTWTAIVVLFVAQAMIVCWLLR